MLKEARGHYILHRCQVPVADPGNHSQYLISVRPKVEEKYIQSSENSEFAPSLLWGDEGTLGQLCTLWV